IRDDKQKSATRSDEYGNSYVRIRRDVLSSEARGALLPVLAHEIGHAVTNGIFPAENMAMAREKFDAYALKLLLGINTAMPLTLKSEEEAWANGQQVFNSVKEYALNTYRKDDLK